ncbi:hypothetical protein [Rhodonellum sp.]|uniref:hypothetical protein n=1 Tax=Rhodonellum sp. TaxID=2231180 RepID=UPI0027172DB8|nr:hypothetical protein [Rhodonellum sp.]MDO9553415.1 hypothetical protein [Rhodonellum sp.]
MKRVIVLWVVIFGLVSKANAQDMDSLLMSLEATSENVKIPLLPDKMMFTQRVFWGEKGLLRVTGIMPLTEANRVKELKIRRTMLISHQVLGYATFVGMIAQGFVGQRLYTGHENMKGLHEGLAGAVNIGYFTDAGLSLFSPPPLIHKQFKGLNSIKAHKILASVHLTAMIATNVLAGKAEDPKWAPVHRAAAFTAFGAFAGAMFVMTF